MVSKRVLVDLGAYYTIARRMATPSMPRRHFEPEFAAI